MCQLIKNFLLYGHELAMSIILYYIIFDHYGLILNDHHGPTLKIQNGQIKLSEDERPWPEFLFGRRQDVFLSNII